jgi:pimeloyl-ACP methyl ester carboxylesterase
MSKKRGGVALAAGLGWVGALPVIVMAQEPSPILATARDGVAVHGEAYFGGLGATAPLVLLFHQGGSNGRGEYAEIATYLNNAGMRAIAWDQRSGGSTHGEENRTVLGLAPSVATDFCSAYFDLQAALDYVISRGLAEEVVAWGSSYSGSLVFRLAAENADRVSGVVAISPASGGPMVDCRARDWLEGVRAPMYVLRPASEMGLASSTEQRDIFMDAGAEFQVVTNGVHGSSMLVDSRTGHDMAAVRADVARWLRRLRSR